MKIQLRRHELSDPFENESGVYGVVYGSRRSVPCTSSVAKEYITMTNYTLMLFYYSSQIICVPHRYVFLRTATFTKKTAID